MALPPGLDIVDPLDAPTAGEIAAIEAKVGAPLPTDVLDFLRLANGAYFPYSIQVHHKQGSEWLSFCSVTSTRPPEPGTLGFGTFLGEIECARGGGVPVNALPIARDGGSSVLYVDLTPEGNGRVLAFIEGLPGWAGHSQEDAIVVLAPSLAEYLSLVRPNESVEPGAA